MKITLVADQPPTSWNRYAPNEYGFYANVNPHHPRPRWSQATEQRIGEDGRSPTYGAAKAALRSLARTLAVELIPREIRVNAVTPGPIDTPILGKVFNGEDQAAQIREKMIGMVPMKRWGKSEESAKAVLFLAFDATFTTGAGTPVEGGWSQL